MIGRINEYAARRFGGVGTTPGSFLRIHVWALAFLLLASVLAPSHLRSYSIEAQRTPVHNVALGFSDQRGYASSPFGKKPFHIAWIMASEGTVLTRKGLVYVPTLMLRSIPEIDHRKVVVDVYYLGGSRIADLYFSLLDAIAAKPDMIVLSLNPVWTMNPVATHQWTQLDARAALALTTKPSAWPVGAALLSPSDLMWGLASKLEPFRDRSYYSAKVHSVVDDLGPLDRSKLGKVVAAQKPDLYHQLLQAPPLDVWFTYRLHLPRGSTAAADFPAPGDQPFADRAALATGSLSPNRWAQWIATSNRGDNPLNTLLLRSIGQALEESKIPSYVYFAQINSGWLRTNPAIQSAVSGVERQLQARRSDFEAKNIRFQPETVSRFVNRLEFLPGDPVHLENAGPLGRYLARQVCQTLTQSGDRIGCSPSGRLLG